MTINETLTLALSCGAGTALGAIFFGGLWWTVRRGVSSQYAALWFLGSLLLRMSIVLTGFYFVGGRHWERLLMCLFGFAMAGLGVSWLTRPSEENQVLSAPEAGHAPYSR
jgi:F1F0 ATPase subunit 2